ncbi:phosphodiester glycosidase family protein [Microlunatus soli]|uniref:Phosphodiester glycosidase domain-containing protein n=1 Tax=Microlunatus soli TaxID=630515 RepID=A0A1H1S6Y7_9ACTN|nr:phosphodiester glycosidase family protein [Microlunatus soli]SDS43049.1 Predicted protein [Microlunatus soli]
MTKIISCSMINNRGSARTALTAASLAAVAVGLIIVPGVAQARTDSLPLGDSDLPEVRNTATLAPGVTLTSIRRGNEPAPKDEILTTTRGPWNVHVLTIDPRRAEGKLFADYGKDLAGTETVGELVDGSGGLAGINAGFFTFTASKVSPGDPVGAGVYGGKLLSEPTATNPIQREFVVDADRTSARIADWSFSATVTDRRTGHRVMIDELNHTPAVPVDCAELTDPTTCAVPGETVWIDPEFGASTPSGPGVEIVQDRKGCLVRMSATERGTTLEPGEHALQATGSDAAALVTAAGNGCTKNRTVLTEADGRPVELTPETFAVNGQPQLTRAGEVVVTPIDDDFNNRNPRSVAGVTKRGEIELIAIDGRSENSVGTSIVETAKVARSLGLVDSLNLDGGGSTTLYADGKDVNTPSGTADRPVGDALIYRK